MVTIFKSHKLDIVSYTITLAICLLIGLEYGLIVGVVVSLCVLIKQTSTPKVTCKPRMTPTGEPFYLLKPDRNILFTSFNQFSDKVFEVINSHQAIGGQASNNNFHEEKLIIVIDGEYLSTSDATFGQGMKQICENAEQQRVVLILYNLSDQVLATIVEPLPHCERLHICQQPDEVYRLISKSHKMYNTF